VPKSLVLTIIGPDRPGVVEHISRCVNEHECNWLASRMSQLAGNFAGIIHVEGEAAVLGGLQAALEQLQDLSIVVAEGIATVDAPHRTVTVTMLGLDRTGIVREVSAELARHQMNVEEWQTDISPAAMTGDPMFNGRALVSVPESVNLSSLTERLDTISHALGVDIELLED